MGKPSNDDSQLFERISSSSPMPPPPPPPPADFDTQWQNSLTQSEPSIQSRTNRYHSSSYKVSIGHETVNITEMTREQKPSSDSTNKRRSIPWRKNVNILSLCFMCFVSASLILIGIATMHLMIKTDHSKTTNELLPQIIRAKNFSSNFFYLFSTSESVSHLLLPSYDHTIRELSTVICLLIVVLNCFCVLIFSIEIYLGSNMNKQPTESSRKFQYFFSSSTSRFIAICSFYASIPAFMLVMCFFILLNLSLLPAIISLIILGAGLIFILITLLSYFSLWQNHPSMSIYHTVDAMHFYDEEFDLMKTDELSTLV